ncbi:cell wall-binding repeat-containing protein [Clostridium sporogenes]|uniref:cell wall-binding repeat-containing protein n=1 Tax=Clostridium sporogenes TaxID=1509 RepID=UPI003F934290
MNKKGTRALASATVVGLVLSTVATGNVKAAPGDVTRVGGSDLYETASKVAKANWKDGAENVVLVSGEGYADSLSASVLATKLNAPIILTSSKNLDKNAKDALTSLKPKNVYVVGGNYVISKEVRNEVKGLGLNIEKELYGNTQFDTNLAIANYLVDDLKVDPSEVLVVNGKDGYADALSVAPVAASKGQVLLIVSKNPADAEGAAKFVKAHNSKVTVVGTKNIVPTAVLEKLGAKEENRVNGGLTQFDTNLNVMKHFGLKYDKVYVADASDTKKGYADALVASAIAGRTGSALILTDRGNSKYTQNAINHIKENKNDKTEVEALGGNAVMPEEVVNGIKDAVKADSAELAAAKKAVKAYEDAKITNLEEINAAKALGVEANKAVEAVKDQAQREALEAKIAAKDKLVAEAEAKLGVKAESVTAINSRTVKVTFPEGSKVEAKDLKDKKITLKAGEVVLTATYAEGSLDNSTAVFAIDDKKELVDATTYTVSADWANFAKTDMLAKITRPYAKTFESVTTKVASNLDEKGDKKDNAKISLTAKDQYGEDIKLDTTTGSTLDVKGTLNGMPLSKDEIVIGDNKDTVEIKRGLKEGDKLSITVQNKSGEKVIGESTFEYTVGKAEVAVPTSVAGIKAAKEGKEVTEVAALDTLTLTADVRDQFNNQVDSTKSNLRWVVAEGKELLADATENGFLGKNEGKDQIDTNGSNFVKLKAEKPGKVVIEAYNKSNGAKAVYTFEIGAKKLTSITAPTEFNGTFNNEELKTTGKFSVNEGAGLTADAIKFNVVSKTTGIEASDIQVSAQLRGGDKADKNDIILVAKTSKPGKFEITPYIGTSFNDEKAVKANTVTLETKLNDIATSVATIGDISAKVGTPVEKEIVIKNKHNEVITAESTGKLNFKVFKDGKAVEENKSVKAEEVSNSKTGKLEKVKFTANAAGNFVVRISVGDSAAFTEVKVSAEVTKLASIDLGADIYDGVVAGDTDKVYRIIDARDNKGDAILPSIDGWTVKSGTTDLAADKKVEVNYVAKNKDGKWEVVDQAKAEAIALVIDPAKNVATEENVPLAIKVTKPATGDDKAIEGNLNVTVKKARALSKITVANKNVSVGLNGETTITFSLQDQYGKSFAVSNLDDLKISSSDATKVAIEENSLKAYDKDGNVTSELAKAVSYKVTVKGAGTGSSTITVQNGEIKDTATVSVAPTAEIAKSIKIIAKDVKTMNEDGAYKYKVGSVEAVPFIIEARDASGNKVEVDTKDVIWTSSNEAVAKVNENGEVKGQLKPEDKDSEVTITATLFGVKNEIKLNVSGQASKLDPASVKLEKAGDVTDLSKIDADANVDGIQLALDGNKEDGEADDGTIVLTFTGNDQYGKEQTVSSKVAKELSYNVEIAKAKLAEDASTLTITPVKEGNTKVTLTIGSKELAFDVKVTSENKIIKDKAADKLAADEAKKILIPAIEDANKKYEGAVEGTEVGNYQVGAKAEFKTAIDAAQAVVDNKDATKENVDKAIEDLKNAKTTFESKAVKADVTAPVYKKATIDSTKKVVTLEFDEKVVNNLTDVPALKAAIQIATDGSTYVALGTNDTVEIKDGKLVVTFENALSGTTNKIKVAANGLKDAAGNLVTAPVETAAIDAN